MRRIDYIDDCEKIQAKLRRMRWDLTLSEVEDFWEWVSEQECAGWLVVEGPRFERARLRESLEAFVDQECGQTRWGDYQIIRRRDPLWTRFRRWVVSLFYSVRVKIKTRGMSPEERTQWLLKDAYVKGIVGLLNSPRILSSYVKEPDKGAGKYETSRYETQE